MLTQSSCDECNSTTSGRCWRHQEGASGEGVIRQLRLPLRMPRSQWVATRHGPRTIQLARAEDVITHSHSLLYGACDRRCPAWWKP